MWDTSKHLNFYISQKINRQITQSILTKTARFFLIYVIIMANIFLLSRWFCVKGFKNIWFISIIRWVQLDFFERPTKGDFYLRLYMSSIKSNCMSYISNHTSCYRAGWGWDWTHCYLASTFLTITPLRILPNTFLSRIRKIYYIYRN